MSSRPSTAAPPRVPSRSASRTVSADGPLRARAASSACLTSNSRSPRSFDAEPSTPSPTRTCASSRSRTGAIPAPRRMFDVGQCATPTPPLPNVSMSESSRWTQCAHHTPSSIQPRSWRYSTGRQPYSSLQYSSSSTVSARCVCSLRPRSRASSADSRISRPVTENGEHGATAMSTIASASRTAASLAVSTRMSSSCSTRESGGRPPSDSPRSIEPRDATIRTPSSPAARISASISPPAPRGNT